MSVSDYLYNAPTAVTTSVGVSMYNMLGDGLPFIINVGTAIYLALLIIHKGWKMYKEWKHGASSE